MLTTQKNTIPAGYKQTEIGVIPEDWDIKQLKDIASKVIDNRGKTPPYSDDASIDLIETVSISFVNQYPDYSKVTKFVSKNIYDYWFRGHPVKDDILISTVGEYSGSSAMMKENRGTIAQNIIALRIKEVDPTYVFYWTRSKDFKKQLDQVMMNQAQPSLRVPWLLNFCLHVPKTKSEQTAIASILSDVDALIEKLEDLIAKKKNIKQGAMQELLTGKRRLPGFSGEWEVKKLGELGKFSKGKGIKKDELVAYGFPCVRYGEIYTTHNYYIKRFHSFIPKNVTPNSQRLKKGDLLFAGSGETAEEIGKCVAFLGSEEAYAGGDIIILSPTDCDSLFLGYLLNHHVVVSQKSRRGQGDAVVHIYSSELSQISISLPSTKAEQTAITTVLSDMDTEITVLEEKLAKYRQIKQGMMQQLLTGKIRVYGTDH